LKPYVPRQASSHALQFDHLFLTVELSSISILPKMDALRTTTDGSARGMLREATKPTGKKRSDELKVACALAFDFSENTGHLLRRASKWSFSFGREREKSRPDHPPRTVRAFRALPLGPRPVPRSRSTKSAASSASLRSVLRAVPIFARTVKPLERSMTRLAPRGYRKVRRDFSRADPVPETTFHHCHGASRSVF